MTQKLVNGVLITLSAEEETARTAEIAEFEKENAIIKASQDKVAADVTSGKAKIKALGLTDDEILALFG
tara:strand:- start:72 stop:278 length:207 start_codon:yes stop_codon:yes gene_type:complete